MSKGEETRKYLLNKAFNLIYENGFQSTSADKIIDGEGITKGAFYYHFKNKKEIGLAVIQEILAQNIKANLIAPLEQEGNKLEIIHNVFRDYMMGVSEKQLKFGCPTNNLIQEMAPLSEQFAVALRNIIHNWQRALSNAIQTGIDQGDIDSASNPDHMAEFIITSYEGARSLGKIYNSFDYYHRFLKELKKYLKK